MPIYIVKPGMRHGAFGQFGPGDRVELSEAEAEAFLDKLELADDIGNGALSVDAEDDAIGIEEAAPAESTEDGDAVEPVGETAAESIPGESGDPGQAAAPVFRKKK